DEAHRLDELMIHVGHLLAGAQIGGGLVPILRPDLVSDAVAGAAFIEAQNQPWPVRRAAIHMGEHAQAPVIAVDDGALALGKAKARIPHQRPVAEHPIFVHGARLYNEAIETRNGTPATPLADHPD